MREHPLLLVRRREWKLPCLACPACSIDLDETAIPAVIHRVTEHVRNDGGVVLQITAAVHNQHNFAEKRRTTRAFGPDIAGKAVPDIRRPRVSHEQRGVSHRFLPARRDTVTGEVKIKSSAVRILQLVYEALEEPTDLRKYRTWQAGRSGMRTRQ